MKGGNTFKLVYQQNEKEIDGIEQWMSTVENATNLANVASLPANQSQNYNSIYDHCDVV